MLDMSNEHANWSANCSVLSYKFRGCSMMSKNRQGCFFFFFIGRDLSKIRLLSHVLGVGLPPGECQAGNCLLSLRTVDHNSVIHSFEI